jgi:heme A synthase
MSGAANTPALTNRPQPLLGATAGAVVALIANTIVFFAGNAILGATIQASTDGTNPSDVQYVAVIAASVLPIVIGAGVLWLLSRFTTAALRVWTIVAIVVTVLSLGGPPFLPVDDGSKIALALMHIAAASAAIFGQWWAARRPSRKA